MSGRRCELRELHERRELRKLREAQLYANEQRRDDGDSQLWADLDSKAEQTDSQAFTGTNSSAIIGVHPVDPWTSLGEEVIELAFIQSEMALEPNIIKAELLNQPVKFSVERPVSPDVMDPDGPMANMQMQHKEGCPECNPW